MPRKTPVKIFVSWADGTENEFKAEDHTSIKQRYRQLNFVTDEGDAVAINMANAKFVQINSQCIDFDDINRTDC